VVAIVALISATTATKLKNFLAKTKRVYNRTTARYIPLIHFSKAIFHLTTGESL